VLFAVVAAAHALGQVIVYQLNHVPSTGVPFYPGVGVTFAALLLAPRRLQPVVLASTFCAELVGHFALHETVATVFGLALSNTVVAAVSAWLVHRWAGGVPLLSRRKDLVAFVVGGAVAGPVAGALIGPPFARLTTASGPYLAVMARWWTGEALGVLIVGGLILAWATERGWPFRPRYAAFEASVLAMLLVLVTWAAFWRWDPAFTYLTLPMAGWASLRFGTRGATTAGAIVASLAEWATVTGHGLFAVVAGTDHSLALWLLQLYLAVLTLTGLVLAAQLAEIGRAHQALRVVELAEREARLQARESAAAERARMARELHDSIGHAVSVMVLQAGAARMSLPADGPASDMAESIEQTGRAALGELDRLLGLLDGVGGNSNWPAEAERQPAFGLQDLHRLAASVRTTGLQVTLQLAGGLPTRPASLDQSAYRIIQEALTNTLKHARASRVDIDVTYQNGRLELSVADDGDASAAVTGQASRVSRGIIGMRERASLFGGDVHAGPAPGGGWQVKASLPVTGGGP
jgi:signal transduction histidine kinase